MDLPDNKTNQRFNKPCTLRCEVQDRDNLLRWHNQECLLQLTHVCCFRLWVTLQIADQLTSAKHNKTHNTQHETRRDGRKN